MIPIFLNKLKVSFLFYNLALKKLKLKKTKKNNKHKMIGHGNKIYLNENGPVFFLYSTIWYVDMVS